jgi:hypothetical protein
MWNSPLLDNGSVSTFPWQRIDAVSDELFEMVIYIRFASKLQERVVQERDNSGPVKSRDSPAPVKKFSPVQEQRQSSRQDSSEVTARAQDENKETRLLFV